TAAPANWRAPFVTTSTSITALPNPSSGPKPPTKSSNPSVDFVNGFQTQDTSKRITWMFAVILLVSVAAKPAPAQAAGYAQTNLVSNGAVPAVHVDPNLVNPWGISFFPGISPFWVSDNNSGVTTLYDGTGSPFPSPATPLVVDIPSPTDP